MATQLDRVRDAARLLYCDGRTPVSVIAEELGVSRNTVNRWATADGWQKGARIAADAAVAAALASGRPPGTGRLSPAGGAKGRDRLVARLYRIIEHSISILETRMSDDNGDDDALTERDMRALGSIVRSIDKLKDLEPGHGKPASKEPKAGPSLSVLDEEERLRRRIVDRILKLRERRGPAGGAG